MGKKRSDRQGAIKWIVRNKPIHTQRDLVSELRLEGYGCTQATVSRDIAEMGLRKLPEGIYVLAEDLHLQRMFSEFVTDVQSANNLVVIKTQPGTAPGVASAVDAADLTNLMGSIAGNDTVLAICTSNESAVTTREILNKLRSASSS